MLEVTLQVLAINDPSVWTFELPFKLVDSNFIPSHTAANRAADGGGMLAHIAAMEKSLVCNVGFMCALPSKQIIMKLPKFACTVSNFLT